MSVESRIRKLWKSALGERKLGNNAVADAFEEKAERLMLQAGIDLATAMASEADPRRREQIIVERIEFSGEYHSRMLNGTYQALSEYRLTQFIRSRGHKEDQAFLVIVGAESNVLRQVEQAESLRWQCVAGRTRWSTDHLPSDVFSEAQRLRERQEWTQGFYTGVAARIRQLYISTVTTGTELVLASDRGRVEEALNALFPERTPGKKVVVSRGSNRAQHAGFTTGMSATLNRGVES